jgi:hypothetical protein
MLCGSPFDLFYVLADACLESNGYVVGSPETRRKVGGVQAIRFSTFELDVCAGELRTH